MFIVNPEQLIDRQLGNYQLEKFLKGGGFGWVYQAKDVKLHRKVAIKFLKPELALNGEAVADFEREVKIIASFEYEHVLKIHHYSEEFLGIPCYVMPLFKQQGVDVPQAVEQVIMKALAKDPQQRYASVRDFAMALEQASEEPATKRAQSFPDLPPTRRVVNSPPEDLNAAGKHEEAIKACEEVLRMNPRDDSVYINKALALNMLGRYKEALQASNQAIALKKTAPAYTNKGWALHELSVRSEDYKEALQAHEDALAINPNFAPAYNGKGNALLALKRYQEALAAYEQAISINPSFVAAYHGQVDALQKLGKFQEAQQAYEQEQRLKR